MLQEKLSEPVVMANKLTKVIRDKKSKVPKHNLSENDLEGDFVL